MLRYMRAIQCVTNRAALPLLLSRHHVTIGAGRGELEYSIVLGTRNNRRKGGPQRGIVDFTQCTQPESGKLEMRQRMLHLLNEYASSGNELYRPACNSWVYLIPSFKRCVETGLSNHLYCKLQRLHSSEREHSSESLSSNEQMELMRARRMFYYELHQRIALLEDSLPNAQLAQLIEWPLLFQRVWIALPVSLCQRTSAMVTREPCLTKSSEVEELSNESVYELNKEKIQERKLLQKAEKEEEEEEEEEERVTAVTDATSVAAPSLCSELFVNNIEAITNTSSIACSSSSLSSLTLSSSVSAITPLSLFDLPHLPHNTTQSHIQRSRNIVPFAKQVYDLPERLISLTQQVMQIVQTELAEILSSSSTNYLSSSTKQQQQEEELLEESSSLEQTRTGTKIKHDCNKLLHASEVQRQVQMRLAQSQARKWNNSINWHLMQEEHNYVAGEKNKLIDCGRENSNQENAGSMLTTN